MNWQRIYHTRDLRHAADHLWRSVRVAQGMAPFEGGVRCGDQHRALEYERNSARYYLHQCREWRRLAGPG